MKHRMPVFLSLTALSAVMTLSLNACSSGKVSSELSGTSTPSVSMSVSSGQETAGNIPPFPEGLASKLDSHETAPEKEYKKAAEELKQAAVLPLREDYSFYSWCNELTKPLHQLLSYGTLYMDDAFLKENPDSSCFIIKADEWQKRVDSTYRMISVTIKKPGSPDSAARYFLQKYSESDKELETVLSDLSYDVIDSSAMLAFEDEIYLLAINPGNLSGKTDLCLWKLDHDYLMWDELYRRPLILEDSYEADISPVPEGFAVVVSENHEGQKSTKYSMSVVLKDNSFSVKRTPAMFESVPVNGDVKTGLLLGLSGSHSMRTLWISPQNGTLNCEEFPDGIYQWNKDHITPLTTLNYSRETIDMNGLEEAVAEDHDWQLITSMMVPSKNQLQSYIQDKYTQTNAGLTGKVHVKEQLHFVGNNCISMENSAILCDIGTESIEKKSFCTIMPDQLMTNYPGGYAVDFPEMNKKARNGIKRELEHYQKVSAVFPPISQTGEAISFSEPFEEWEQYVFLTRHEGKVRAALPVMGNSLKTDEKHVKSYDDIIYLDADLPDSITGHDRLCIDFDTIRRFVPGATDAVSSPDQDLLAVMTDRQILIYTNPGPKEDLLKPVMRIPVSYYDGEQIIMSCWVDVRQLTAASEALQRAGEIEIPLFESEFQRVRTK